MQKRQSLNHSSSDNDEDEERKIAVTDYKVPAASPRKFNYKIRLPVMSTFSILPEGFRQPDPELEDHLEQKVAENRAKTIEE